MTCYRIRHRLKLKYSHFARFLLIAHRAAHQPQKKREPVWGMSLRKVTLLGSNLASVTDLKRIETPHSLCCDFGGYKTFTTRWSGGRVQVWVQVWAPACHLAISPKAVPEGNQRFRGQNQRPSSWGSTFNLHQSRNELDGHWVLGRTNPDLKLSLQLKRHVCTDWELSYLDPHIVRQCKPCRGCPACAKSWSTVLKTLST